MEWLDKLRQIKDSLDYAGDVGADYLRKAAAALRKIAEAAEGAADSIDPTPGEISARGDGVAEAEAFLRECETESRSAAGGAWWAIFGPIIVDIVRKWLERRNPA